MTAVALLANAAQLGITIWAESGKVRYRPKAAMTAELVTQLTAKRDELLLLLSAPPASPNRLAPNAMSQIASAGAANGPGNRCQNEPFHWGNGQSRRLVGNAFPPRLPASVPKSIVSDPPIICPACNVGRVLSELRKMTGGLCYACWEGARS